MRRRAQRPPVHLVAFWIALSILLYLNHTDSTGRAFASKTIRYRITSVALPEARGSCPGLSDSSKPAIVVERVEADGNPTCLDVLRQKYHLCIYTNDAPLDRTSMRPSDCKNAAPGEDRVAGRILSYIWHILFIRHDDSPQGRSRGVSLERGSIRRHVLVPKNVLVAYTGAVITWVVNLPDGVPANIECQINSSFRIIGR